MRYTITGRNIEVTPGLRDAVQDKLGKLEKYFSSDTEVIVTLSVQRELQKIEVTIPVKAASSGPKRPALTCTCPSTWWKRS